METVTTVIENRYIRFFIFFIFFYLFCFFVLNVGFGKNLKEVNDLINKDIDDNNLEDDLYSLDII